MSGGWIKLEKDLREDLRMASRPIRRPRIPPDNIRALAQRYGCFRGGEAVYIPCYWCGDIDRIVWPEWSSSPQLRFRGRGPTIDHLMPFARGGTHAVANLVLACGFCNSSRRDLTAEEFLGMALG